METVLITGGSGLIGKHLELLLKTKGYRVIRLSRTKDKDIFSTNTFYWNIEKQELDNEAIDTADYIIHLAGAGIADKRWTLERKKEILESRVKSAELIFKKVKERNRKLKAYITSSGVGYYGAITTETIFKETDEASDDFLGNICKAWESSADKFNDLGIRTVKLRTAIVLASNGGAFPRLLTPIKFGFASAIGDGKQYMSWIHIEDLCAIYLKAIEDDKMVGAFNAVSTEHVTNKDFTKQLAHAINRPFWPIAIPAVLMKTLFGELSVVLLTGSRVSNEKIKTAGYIFKYSTLKQAILDLIS
ncbi:MAG: TIGR01777 family oxidoreductase [Bacteroidota bacterium]